ncbi:MAG: S-methyl-5-thioribose kinase [Actinomycetota bacterium]|nr:S-methyl-5-thioribose kinase [Actinomycetota bacterium]
MSTTSFVTKGTGGRGGSGVVVPPGYAPLSSATAAALAASVLGPSFELSGPVEEIGDGNLNLVFRVPFGDRTVVVKQALPYLRVVGEGWPLTLDRARVEAEALSIASALAPGRVPEVFGYVEDQAAIVMECLSHHVVWRGALVAGVRVGGVAEQVGWYCARTLMGTSAFCMDDARRRQMVARFANPELCAISEDLVFTAPFGPAASNRIDGEVQDLAASVFDDSALRSEAARLRWEFRTCCEALLHGDLHTGSVMVAPGDARVIDPEFAFFGPMAFDVGSLLGNLALSRSAHAASGSGFVGALDEAAGEFWEGFRDEAARSWPTGEPWREQFFASLIGRSARFAGAEMVRRTFGLAHVADIDSLGQPAREKAQRAAIASARELMTGPAPTSFGELWTRAGGSAV